MFQDGNSTNASNLTREALIRSELTGKSRAIEGYDSMLWKIRSGYAAILYGALSLVVGTRGLDNVKTKEGVVLGILIIGFSISAGLLDYTFLRCKIRVVQASDKLTDVAMKIATGQALNECEENGLAELLHNSGELRRKVRWCKYGARTPLLALYVGTPVIGIIAVFFMVRFPTC